MDVGPTTVNHPRRWVARLGMVPHQEQVAQAAAQGRQLQVIEMDVPIEDVQRMQREMDAELARQRHVAEMQRVELEEAQRAYQAEVDEARRAHPAMLEERQAAEQQQRLMISQQAQAAQQQQHVVEQQGRTLSQQAQGMPRYGEAVQQPVLIMQLPRPVLQQRYAPLPPYPGMAPEEIEQQILVAGMGAWDFAHAPHPHYQQ